MTEKTEEQIAKEKAAVEAMRNAKSNMDAVLVRNADLERALALAIDWLGKSKQYISAGVYLYSTRDPQSIHAHIDTQTAQLRKTLG